MAGREGLRRRRVETGGGRWYVLSVSLESNYSTTVGSWDGLWENVVCKDSTPMNPCLINV